MTHRLVPAFASHNTLAQTALCFVILLPRVPHMEVVLPPLGCVNVTRITMETIAADFAMQTLVVVMVPVTRQQVNASVRRPTMGRTVMCFVTQHKRVTGMEPVTAWDTVFAKSTSSLPIAALSVRLEQLAATRVCACWTGPAAVSPTSSLRTVLFTAKLPPRVLPTVPAIPRQDNVNAMITIMAAPVPHSATPQSPALATDHVAPAGIVCAVQGTLPVIAVSSARGPPRVVNMDSATPRLVNANVTADSLHQTVLCHVTTRSIVPAKERATRMENANVYRTIMALHAAFSVTQAPPVPEMGTVPRRDLAPATPTISALTVLSFVVPCSHALLMELVPRLGSANVTATIMVRTVKPFAILQPPALATALAPRWGNANVTRITLDKGAALFVSHNPHALEMVTAPLLASAHAMQISLPRIAA